MIKVAEYTISRKKATGYAVIIGFILGLLIALFLPLDLTFRPALFGWLVAAIFTIIILHESVHGLAAILFGYRPIFGIKIPLVYVTFTEKIPRRFFITVALAPLFIINIIFGILFVAGFLGVFSLFCLIINTLGAIGDVWIVLKLVRCERGTLIQDTKTGIEVWR